MEYLKDSYGVPGTTPTITFEGPTVRPLTEEEKTYRSLKIVAICNMLGMLKWKSVIGEDRTHEMKLEAVKIMLNSWSLPIKEHTREENDREIQAIVATYYTTGGMWMRQFVGEGTVQNILIRLIGNVLIL